MTIVRNYNPIVIKMSIEILLEEESDLNDPSTDIVFDLDDCCRTCLQHECSLTPTNSSDSDSIKFCDKLTACISGMKWAKEGVPSFICGLCIEKLRIAYDFQTVCLQSDQTLQLQKEASEIQSFKSATADPTTTTDLAEFDKIVENVILNVKAEETQIKPLPQCTPVTSAATRLEAIQTSGNSRKNGCQVCGEKSCEHIERLAGNKCSECSVCLKQFTTTADLTAHMRKHSAEWLHACNLCGNRYLNKANLLVHMGSHTEENTCSYCDKKFTARYLLNSHLKIHIEDKLWPCQTCNKSYTKSAHLIRHMKTHTGEKFSCKLCDKKFTQSSSLGVHMRRHTGDKLWLCQICNRSFTQSSHLTCHMKTHTGEKFSCKLCDKTFQHSSSLFIHMKRHTSDKLWSCQTCNKSYTLSSNLARHMRTHSGKKFSCKLCDKEFTDSSTLRVHTKKHTGEKFSCKLCDKKFTYSSSLSAHMKRHTGDKL